MSRTSLDRVFLETYAHETEVAMAQVRTHATLDDLYRVEGKAEIVDGELVLMSPTDFLRPRGRPCQLFRGAI